jgi:AraC-like DNA-binding protein
MELFFVGREQELLALIEQAQHGRLIGGHGLQDAACRGTNTNLYYPDDGQPDDLALARCRVCSVRLACLAGALGTEEPGDRYGWWGGLSPEDREETAANIASEAPWEPPSRATEAVRLRAAGWTINAIATTFGCSRRTVQRYLRIGETAYQRDEQAANP